MQSPKHIQYRKSEVTEKDGTKTIVHDKVEVETSYTRFYHSALDVVAVLSPCARNLLDYLCATMSKSNNVDSNYIKRVSFIKRMRAAGVNGGEGYSHGTVQRAFVELWEQGLLLKTKRGLYQVNPEYFMKNKAEKRDELIKRNYEYNSHK